MKESFKNHLEFKEWIYLYTSHRKNDITCSSIYQIEEYLEKSKNGKPINYLNVTVSLFSCVLQLLPYHPIERY